MPLPLRLERADAEEELATLDTATFRTIREKPVEWKLVLPDHLSGSYSWPPPSPFHQQLRFANLHSHGPDVLKVARPDASGILDFGEVEPGIYAIVEGTRVLAVVRVRKRTPETQLDDTLEIIDSTCFLAVRCPRISVVPPPPTW
jgi:hypothetical protein